MSGPIDLPMAAVLNMPRVVALSSSVLGALKQRLTGLIGAGLAVGLPLYFLLPGIPRTALVLVVLLSLWLWRLTRRALATLASRALSIGDLPRSRRLYQFLRFTTLDGEASRSCLLSLAACEAVAGSYELALGRLARLQVELEGALLAVSLNLRAYCMARMHQQLELALQMSEESIALRPQVPGFRHTRGLIMLELGRLDHAARDLDATWRQGQGSDLLEAERCFDLGRLWSARGHGDYASDYFERSVRAAPESRWAALAASLLGERSMENQMAALL